MALIDLNGLGDFKEFLESTYGTANNPAKLNAEGKVPNEQLPSNVFNVQQFETFNAFPETGEENKIYIDRSTNNLYRYENNEYIAISSVDSIKYIEQELTDEEKEQARNNIGAISINDIPEGNFVRYDIDQQSLTNSQQENARKNIGAISANEIPEGSFVRYDTDQQGLSTEQQEHARNNIGAISIDEIPEGSFVRYDTNQQGLSIEQQQYARQNIGAISVNEIPEGSFVRYDTNQQGLDSTQKQNARTNINAASATEVNGLSETVGNINNRLNNFGNFVREVNATEEGLEVIYDNNQRPVLQTGLVFDNGYVDDNFYLRLKKGDTELAEEVYTPIKLPEGGGGGGGSGVSISINNVVKPRTARNGADAIFSFNASASDDTDLTIKWFVNEKLIETQIGESGNLYSLNVKDYLLPSTENTVKVIIESESEQTLTSKWRITTIAFAVEWGSSVKPVMLYTTDSNIYIPINVSAESNTTNIVYINVGNNALTPKTVYGSQTLTVEIDKSKFTTGSNLITAYMVSAEDSDDKTKTISFSAIWGYGATTPIVSFSNPEMSCTQYDVVDIPYFVFDPDNEVVDCSIQVGTETPRSTSANRTLQYFRYTPLTVTGTPEEDEDGNMVVKQTFVVRLTCNSSSTTMNLIVKKSDYNLSYYIDDSLRYNLDPVGHSNSDADRASFAGIEFSENFDWENGGFKTDQNGVTAFVVKKGNRAILPRSLFADADTLGKTIDISFKVTNSDAYDAVAISDLNESETRGIVLHANNGEIMLNNKVGKEFRYCEDTRIDFSVLVENEGASNRIYTLWLDGIPSKVEAYTTNMLVQSENPMVIGSDHCDVWIYYIRAYNSHLSKQKMIQNYIAAANTTAEKVTRYQANNIIDNNDKISVADLRKAAPNLVIVKINAPRMTTSKSDNVAADIEIIDGSTTLTLAAASDPSASTLDGAVFKVQGTSSSAYGRSSYNLDIDFKGTGKKYKLSEDAIGVNYINIKVNVASSECANNINAVDWYNTFQPYLTESRKMPGRRDSVQGKPCAVFITNTNNKAVWFSSILVQPGETVLYAMGDICNSKKNKDVFGQDNKQYKDDEDNFIVEHPTKACIEVSGNDTDPQRFRSTAAVFIPEADDGKGRWETTEIVDGEEKQIKHFEWRMNPSSSNQAEVVESWDNLVAWVVSTIGDSAKFKREVGNYFSIKSLLYHFLFIEYFAAYDNVSKNTFYSYDWDEESGKYLWNINKAYDMDTILAADNDGKPLGDYGLDYGDANNGRSYFNAVDNPIWVNIQDAYKKELSNLYNSLRSKGAWSSSDMAEKWDNYQSIRPHAAMVIDAYNKYILPYKTSGMTMDNEVQGSDDSYLPRMQGSKTYWRKQFLTYQTAYMDGKYGYYSKTSATNFRTNCASTTKDFTIKVYAKTYITMLADDNVVATKKIESGETAIFNNVSVGNNTTLYVTPERLVQYIRPLNETDNSTFSASGASKLMEAILGGDAVNLSWPATDGLSISSVLLHELSIRNMANFSSSLDLKHNIELESLDTRGTNTGAVMLPSFAPLTTIQLNACTGIEAYNLYKVETFTMENGNNLTSIKLENCNNIVDSAIANYLLQTINSSQTGTKRIRAININWTFSNLDALCKIATTWKGYNTLGNEQDAPVITGTIHIGSMSTKKLEAIHNIWGTGDLEDSLDTELKIWTGSNLTITYDALIPYFTVTFLNADGSAIKNKNNQNYVQYIDLGGTAYDPIEAGEIDTPSYTDESGQYTYTFTGWTNIDGTVNADKNVTATYSQSVNTYTVRWFDKPGGNLYDKREGVLFGAEAVYDPDGTIGYPTMSDKEIAGVYSVFTGWDKSTGFVRSDIDVYATWSEGALPSPGTVNLKDMSIAQIYGIAKARRASEFFEDEDYIDIKVGKDFNFSNVTSRLLLEERYFNGNEVAKFNDIKLFDENAPSFTLAIDYEFCEATTYATIVSCCDSTGNTEGFRVYTYMTDRPIDSEAIVVHWGDKDNTVAHGLNRGILVLRHQKGSKNLLIASDNGGRFVAHSNYSGGDDFPNDVWQVERHDAYNDSIHFSEIPRIQDTQTDACLSFGAVAYGSQGFQFPAKGWIHWAKIWYDDLGTQNVIDLASWPHETWRMHYRGNGLYNKTDGTGLKDSASFIANAPLSQFYEMYAYSSNQTTTTSGGWKNSLLRSFINTRCFKALPYEWQSIIQPVNIATKGGSDNYNNIENTTDKLYVPAYADLATTTTNLISAEGFRVSWFLENKYRIKFLGITIPDNAQIITDLSDDPTLYSIYTIKEGDIWIPSSQQNNVGYIYLSADTAAKHGFYGGRPINDLTNNITANGAQGGLWVRSITYWTRTNATMNSTSNQSYQYAVYPNGSVSGAYVYYPEYQRRGIVLMFSI